MRDAVPIAVLGAGSWGTALAILLARNGQPTVLWGRDPVFMAELASTRCNARYLPAIDFPPSLHISADLPQALSGAATVLMAVPSAGFHDLLHAIQPHIGSQVCVSWATKGLDPGSGRLLHHIASDVFGPAQPLAVVSGPTFALEVAGGLPTAVTVASQFAGCASCLATALHNDNFRTYTCADVTGVELGGAMKNVLAIAAGIADGLRLGANTRAALITRGLAEMMRLGVALGGQRETLMGLAGLGDLVLSCTNDLSRNRRLGLALARGETLIDALTTIGQVVEGLPTALELMRVATALHVELPIVEQVHHVLYDGRPARAAVQALLNREQKPEAW